MSDEAKVRVFRAVQIVWLCTWIWWGIELLGGRERGPGAIAAWIGLGLLLVFEWWSRAARRARREAART